MHGSRWRIVIRSLALRIRNKGKNKGVGMLEPKHVEGDETGDISTKIKKCQDTVMTSSSAKLH